MKNKHSNHNLQQLIEELKENPLRKFKLGFGLLSIIALSVFFYLILVRPIANSILVAGVGLLSFALSYNLIWRAFKRLIHYAAQARETSQRKSTFVANVSHEVRNPLSILKLSLENLHDGMMGKINQKQKSAIVRSQETIDRLIRMVSELLDLSKIEAGKATMQRSLIDITSLINDELHKFTEVLKTKNLQLEKQTPATPLKIWGDRDKIVQVIGNLFDNAIKYTEQNKKIAVRLNSLRNQACLEIEDAGEGIPKDKLEKIFDKFERVTKGKALGTGLGLPIVKDIIQMHRGEIRVESEVGKGSKFIVLLPKSLRRGR